MGARTKARKRALDVLFEADQRGLDPVTLLADRIAAARAPSRRCRSTPSTWSRASSREQDRIDELLATHAHGWTIDRMPAVDRALLRIGTWEILFNDDVPDAVAVDEAVELARSLSTDESPQFVNGLLGRIVDLKPTLLA